MLVPPSYSTPSFSPSLYPPRRGAAGPPPPPPASSVPAGRGPRTGRNHVCQCDRWRRTDRPGSCLIRAGWAGRAQSVRARSAAASHTQIGNYVVLAPSGLLYGVPLSLSRSLAVSLARSLPRSLPPSFACSIARLHLALSPSYSTPSFSPSLYPPLPISLSPPLLSLACSTSTAASQNPQIWRPLLLHHPHLPSACAGVCVYERRGGGGSVCVCERERECVCVSACVAVCVYVCIYNVCIHTHT